MSKILQMLVGHEVMIYSGESGGFSDHGVIKDFDEQVVLLECADKLLIFPIVSIRVIRAMS